MSPELNLCGYRPLGCCIRKKKKDIYFFSGYLTSSPVQVCLNKLTSVTCDEPVHTLSREVKMWETCYLSPVITFLTKQHPFFHHHTLLGILYRQHFRELFSINAFNSKRYLQERSYFTPVHDNYYRMSPNIVSCHIQL